MRSGRRTVTRSPVGMLPQFSLHEMSGTGLPMAVHEMVMVPPTETLMEGGGGLVTTGAEQPTSSLRS